MTGGRQGLKSSETWLLLACGVFAGTVVNLLIGVLFRFVGTLALQATARPDTDSPAMYATWPLFGRFVASALSPAELLYGALAGVLIATVLHWWKGLWLPAYLTCGLAFAALVFVRELPLSLADPRWGLILSLGIVGNTARGAFLGWVAENLRRRWSAT